MKNRYYVPLAAIATVFLLSTSLTAQKLKAEEIIAKHLDSIAAADKRAVTKTLVGTGEVQVDYISQKINPQKDEL